MKAFCRNLIAAALLCAGAAACNNDELPPAAGFTTVNGTIVDARNGKPIAGAVVTIDTLLTATTDAQGKFSIVKVPSGLVDYTVQATGYAPVTESTSAEPNKPFELDLTMTASPPHA